uniref:MFS domain-containing protein n=1 Tax=Rhabditophanes sp. KR3021 TaxID=114890 RepID=A0AC35U8D5_9BILA
MTRQILKFVIVYICYTYCVYARKFFFNYLDEITLEIDITPSSIGLIISIQYGALILGKMIMSAAVDFIKPLKFLSLSVMLVSSCIFMLGRTVNLEKVSFLIAMISFFQSGAWCVVAKLMTLYFNKSSLPFLLSILITGNNLAGMLLLVRFDNQNWKDTLVIAGGVGVASVVLLHLVFESDGEDKPNTDGAIIEKKEMSTASDFNKFMKLLSRGELLFVAISYLFVLECRALADTRNIMYVKSFASVNSEQFQIAYEIGAILGALSTGFIATKLPLSFCSKGITILALVLTAVLYLTNEPSIICMFGIGASINMGISFWETVGIFLTPPDLLGKSVAFVSTISNLGPILTGFPFEYILSVIGEHSIANIFFAQIIIYSAVILLKYGYTNILLSRQSIKKLE